MLHRALNIYVKSFSGLSRDIWLLAAVMLINRAGTMVIPFMTVYLTQSLGFTLPQAGLVMTCFGAGSVLGAYLGGQFTDRFGLETCFHAPSGHRHRTQIPAHRHNRWLAHRARKT